MARPTIALGQREQTGAFHAAPTALFGGIETNLGNNAAYMEHHFQVRTDDAYCLDMQTRQRAPPVGVGTLEAGTRCILEPGTIGHGPLV